MILYISVLCFFHSLIFLLSFFFFFFFFFLIFFEMQLKLLSNEPKFHTHPSRQFVRHIKAYFLRKKKSEYRLLQFLPSMLNVKRERDDYMSKVLRDIVWYFK